MSPQQILEIFAVIALVVISVIAVRFAKESWGKGAVLVAAVVRPVFVVIDLASGDSGFGLWLFIPVVYALAV